MGIATRIFSRTMFQIGQVVRNRYQLRQQLGNNAGRQTWLAHDLSALKDDCRVVIKVLLFGSTTSWDALKLFEREAKVLQQLDHPRLPSYHDFFSLDDPLPWIALVQSYIPGSSLKQQLDGGRRFTELELIIIARAILKILDYLHCLSPPVIHRDLKPSNVILGTDNRIYLVDFGAVQDRGAKQGATFTVVGTYGYTPMEQFGGRAVPASDFYALAATIVHLATGIPPADLLGDDGRFQFRDRLMLCPEFVNWLYQMTEPLVGNRFSTARAALEALENARNSKPATANHKTITFTMRGAKPTQAGSPLGHTSQHATNDVIAWGKPTLYQVVTAYHYLNISLLPGGWIRWLFSSPDDNSQQVTPSELRTLLMLVILVVGVMPLLVCALGLSWSLFPYVLTVGCVVAGLLAFDVGHSQCLSFNQAEFHITYQLSNWVYQEHYDQTDRILGVFLQQRPRKNNLAVNTLCIRVNSGYLYEFSNSRLQEEDYYQLIQTINTWLRQE